MSTAYEKNAWAVATDGRRESARRHDGRFGEQELSSPEVSLPTDDVVRVGDRVQEGSGPAQRVRSITGEMVILGNPEGTRVVTTIDKVTKLHETAEERAQNEKLESALSALRAGLKSASRQQIERLDNESSDSTSAMLAEDRMTRLIIDGHIPRETYLVASAMSKGRPKGARHAVMATVAREHLSHVEYQALTETWQRVIGRLPD